MANPASEEAVVRVTAPMQTTCACCTVEHNVRGKNMVPPVKPS